MRISSKSLHMYTWHMHSSFLTLNKFVKFSTVILNFLWWKTVNIQSWYNNKNSNNPRVSQATKEKWTFKTFISIVFLIGGSSYEFCTRLPTNSLLFSFLHSSTYKMGDDNIGNSTKTKFLALSLHHYGLHFWNFEIYFQFF